MSVHLQSWDVSKNVHSLLRKYDDVTELCRDRRIDLLCLTETLQAVNPALVELFKLQSHLDLRKYCLTVRVVSK